MRVAANENTGEALPEATSRQLIATSHGDAHRRPARWQRRHRMVAVTSWAALRLVLMTVGTSVVGIYLATPDGSGLVQPLDTLAARHATLSRPPLVAAALRMVARLDTVTGAVIVGVAATIGVGWRRRRERGWHAVLPVASAGAVAVTAAVVAARVVDRPGPGAGGTAARTVLDAFPSATMAALVSIAAAVAAGGTSTRSAVRGRWTGVTGATTAAAVIATASILIGRHWLSDELFGGVLGAAVGVTVVRAYASPSAGRRWRRARVAVAVMLLIAVPPAAVSYWGALHAPGYAANDARTVDWMRLHGMSTVVDRLESWWLWRHLPPTTGQITSLASPPLPAADFRGRRPAMLAADVVPLIEPRLPSEGVWSVVQQSAATLPEIATTSIRADTAHPAVVATLAWLNQASVRFSLIAGTREPVGRAGPSRAAVPIGSRSTLLAAFNSGYRMQDTPGGAMVEGMTWRSLREGVATLAVRGDGSLTIGQWGRDLTSTTGLVAVRQNLDLIVDGGHLVAGLRTNAGQRWGAVDNVLPTWRSGIGIDAAGNLLYASGPELTLTTLATALQRAGAVTAMELDIHRHMVTFNLFTDPPGAARPIGHKLSADMTEPATRYLAPDQRDFVAVFSH